MTDKKMFSEIKDEIEKFNLASYDIKNNPSYAMIINEMNRSICKRNTDEVGCLEKEYLVGLSSKDTQYTPVLNTDDNQEKHLNDRFSHNESNPDILIDDQEDMELNLQVNRSLVSDCKHEGSGVDKNHSNYSKSDGLKNQATEFSKGIQESDRD